MGKFNVIERQDNSEIEYTISANTVNEAKRKASQNRMTNKSILELWEGETPLAIKISPTGKWEEVEGL